MILFRICVTFQPPPSRSNKCQLCHVFENITLYEKGVNRCNSCNGIFRITPKHTEQHFSRYSKEEHTRLKNKKGDKRFWKIVSDEYLKYLKSKTDMDFNQVLDVGSYYGSFVKSLQDMNIDAEGIEANQNLVELSVTKDIHNVYFDEHFKSDKKYDLISLTQMIYYLPDNFAILQKCHQLLNDNGIIFISTINPESTIIKKKLVPIFQPHINVYLSKKNYSDLDNFELLDYTAYMPYMFSEMYRGNKLKMIKYMIGLKKAYAVHPNGNHAFLLLKKI